MLEVVRVPGHFMDITIRVAATKELRGFDIKTFYIDRCIDFDGYERTGRADLQKFEQVNRLAADMYRERVDFLMCNKNVCDSYIVSQLDAALNDIAKTLAEVITRGYTRATTEKLVFNRPIKNNFGKEVFRVQVVTKKYKI